jgi:hypothetical protein
MKKGIYYLALIVVLSSCASVPKESVELSATVGRDVIVAYHAHKALAVLLFDRMKKDVTIFIDDIYAPYQIGELLKQDYADANSSEYESMTGTIIDAAKNSTDIKKQKDAIGFMNDFITVVHDDIEDFRKTLLAPIEEQEREVLASIDRSYNQIIYANSIVTGHLASVRKVYDAQESILNEFGIEDLRGVTNKKLADYSTGVENILGDLKKVDVDEIDGQIEDVKKQFNKLFNK